MNDEAQQDAPHPAQRSSGKRIVAIFMLMLIVGGAGALYYFWRYPKPSTKHAIKTLQAHHVQHAQHIEDLQEKVQALQTRTPPHSSFSALMDAKQTVLLADYQLRFNLNSETAVQLLDFATQQLDIEHRPAFSKVHAAIQKNIELINEHPIPDTTQTIQEIASIKKSLATWQPNAQVDDNSDDTNANDKATVTAKSTTEPNDGRWAKVWEQIKIALHNMVIVSYTEAPAPYPTLHHMQQDQDESLFLLSQAQWAIMNHDLKAFRNAMQSTIEHLHRAIPKRNTTIHKLITDCDTLLKSYAHLDQLNVQNSMRALTKAFDTIGAPPHQDSITMKPAQAAPSPNQATPS